MAQLSPDANIIGQYYGYDPSVISIRMGDNLPPDDYVLIHQDADWCAFVDDYARQDRALRNCFVVIFKPDAIARGLQGVLLAEWQQAGFVLEDMQNYSAATVKFWTLHYAEQQSQPWFERLIRAMANRPIMILILYQPSVARATAIQNARQFMQVQRSKYALDGPNNTIHVSDSEEAAVREARIWIYGIKPEELPADEAEADGEDHD